MPRIDSNAMREEIIDRLTKTIQITGNANSNLYVITYRDSNPQQAQNIVSSLLKIFFESSTGDKRQDSRSALKFLDEQITRYEQSLQMAENRLKDFRLKYMGVPGQGGPANQDYFARISRLGDDIANAKLELRAAVESRDAYRRELTAQTSALATTRSTAAPVSVPEIDARIASQKTKLDELLRSFTDEHPDVVGTRRVIAELEEQRKQELQLRERAAATAGKPAAEPADRFSAIQQIRVSLADAEAKVASAQSKLTSYEGQYAQLTASGRMIPAGRGRACAAQSRLRHPEEDVYGSAGPAGSDGHGRQRAGDDRRAIPRDRSSARLAAAGAADAARSPRGGVRRRAWRRTAGQFRGQRIHADLS